jgi:hypothetical protein
MGRAAILQLAAIACSRAGIGTALRDGALPFRDHRSMAAGFPVFFIGLATDYDGTLAKDGRADAEFCQALEAFKATGWQTWEHHLRAGDYSAWFRDIIKDKSLAREAAEAEQDRGLGAGQSRARIKAAILQRYSAPRDSSAGEQAQKRPSRERNPECSPRMHGRGCSGRCIREPLKHAIRSGRRCCGASIELPKQPLRRARARAAAKKNCCATGNRLFAGRRMGTRKSGSV